MVMLTQADLPAEIPLFPLPGALLLPRGKLPLHIFEPRYRRMIEDCMATPARLIGMIGECRCRGTVRLSQIGCAGRLTAFSETEDGRYMITLTGVSRFRLGRTVEAGTPYLRAEVDWHCFTRDLGQPESDPAFDRDSFMPLLAQYFHAQGLDAEWQELCDSDDEFLVNALSTLLPFSAEDKQALLEAPCLPTRRETLVTLLELGARGGPGLDGPGPGGRKPDCGGRP